MNNKWIRCLFMKHVLAPSKNTTDIPKGYNSSTHGCIYCGNTNPHEGAYITIKTPYTIPYKNWNRRIGKISQFLSPHLSYCGKCLTTWDWVIDHSTLYRHGSACFVLCEKCWNEETPETRLSYYEKLSEIWEKPYWEKHRFAIKKAVLDGK